MLNRKQELRLHPGRFYLGWIVFVAIMQKYLTVEKTLFKVRFINKKDKVERLRNN